MKNLLFFSNAQHFMANQKIPMRKDPRIELFIQYSIVLFATRNTQLAIHHKLNQIRSSDNISKNFYFNRLPRKWNYLLVINTDLNFPTMYKLCTYL